MDHVEACCILSGFGHCTAFYILEPVVSNIRITKQVFNCTSKGLLCQSVDPVNLILVQGLVHNHAGSKWISPDSESVDGELHCATRTKRM